MLRQEFSRKTLLPLTWPQTAQNDGLVDSQNPSPGGMDGRQFECHRRMSYLDAVKHQFHDRPDVYNRFLLDIMKDFKSQ